MAVAVVVAMVEVLLLVIVVLLVLVLVLVEAGGCVVVELVASPAAGDRDLIFCLALLELLGFLELLGVGCLTCVAVAAAGHGDSDSDSAVARSKSANTLL